jgi:uncharacterized protein (TIGR02246 family)
MTSRHVRGICVAAALVLLAPSVAGAQSPSDERALTQLVERWAIARNANDAEAMRPLFDAQVDQIRATDGNVMATDRDGVVRWFDAGFKTDGKGSTVRVGSTRVRVLTADAGLVDYAFTLQGADGTVTANGHATLVCLKRGADWKVIALRFASARPAPTAATPGDQP